MVRIAELQAQELRRTRWRREREALRLVDPTSSDFTTVGLVSHASNIHVRMVILPPDPEAWLLEFDDSLWDWWLVDRPVPFAGRKVAWWPEHLPAQHAAIRFKRSSDDRLDDYLALHRHGGLELGLGRAGARERPTSEGADSPVMWRQFHLTSIVGRVWAAVDLYGAVVEHLSLAGPWELSLALRRTEGAHLGYLGEGWLEPRTGLVNELPVCRELGLLVRRELDMWPTADDARALAFSLGGWIEGSWGMRQRRFLAQRGAYAGQFALDRALQ